MSMFCRSSRVRSLAVLVATWTASVAHADETMTLRQTWDGNIQHLLTGASLGEDADNNGEVDGPDQPASIVVGSADVPLSATLVSAHLYWGGTQTQPSNACSSSPDDVVTLTTPGGGTHTVTGTDCYCADGGASSYDIQVCNTDITALVDNGTMVGTWTVADYSGRMNDTATANASTSLLLSLIHI